MNSGAFSLPYIPRNALPSIFFLVFLSIYTFIFPILFLMPLNGSNKALFPQIHTQNFSFYFFFICFTFFFPIFRYTIITEASKKIRRRNEKYKEIQHSVQRSDMNNAGSIYFILPKHIYRSEWKIRF